MTQEAREKATSIILAAIDDKELTRLLADKAQKEMRYRVKSAMDAALEVARDWKGNPEVKGWAAEDLRNIVRDQVSSGVLSKLVMDEVETKFNEEIRKMIKDAVEEWMKANYGYQNIALLVRREVQERLAEMIAKMRAI